jgi:hypothetical protein
MNAEVRGIRAEWQSLRQELIRSDYNHADEQLARAMYYANTNPLIAGILNRLRLTSTYNEFDADKWLSGRGDADIMGAGNTSLRLSLDMEDRTAQILKVLEMTVEKGNDGLLRIGWTTYSGSSTKLVERVRSAIEVIFEPFYNFIDKELRTMESLISPTDVMNQIQSLVDSTTSMQYAQTHKLLTDVYRQLFTLTAESTGESWYQVGYSCRHVLIQFANEVFHPNFVPEGQEQPKGDDAKEKLKWTVQYYLKKDGRGNRYRESIKNIIKANWDFVNSFGHRQKTATETDARLAVIYTYLTINIVDNIIKITK